MIGARGARFIWRLVRRDGSRMLFKEFIDDGSTYDEIRDSPEDKGWWTGEERWVDRSLFAASTNAGSDS